MRGRADAASVGWMGVEMGPAVWMATWVVAAMAHAAAPEAVHAELREAAGWTASHVNDGVQVYRKDLTTVGLTAWKGVTTAPPGLDRDHLLKVLSDSEAHPSFNTALSESVIISKNGGTTVFYQVFSPPTLAPVSDRWWVTEARSERDIGGVDGRHARTWSTLQPDEASELRHRLRTRLPDAVEVTQSYGGWDLIPLEDGSTRIIYRNVTDTGGAVPHVVASRVTGRAVADNIHRMVDYARKTSR